MVGSEAHNLNTLATSLEGNQLQYGDKCRIRHVPTQRYLTVAENNKNVKSTLYSYTVIHSWYICTGTPSEAVARHW